MRRLFFLTLCIYSSLFAVKSIADEYSPAYLELKQTSAENFEVLWKVPANGIERRLALYLDFSDEVVIIQPPRTSFAGNAFIERSLITIEDGLTGATINIEGLSRLATDVLVRIEWIEGTTEVARLTPATTSFVVAGPPQRLEVATTYLLFGIEHIWEGLDHLLFVACLILIARTWRRILITITGFTLAHSVTLTLAALELVRLPVPPIEAIIALSIVFLAREIALDSRDSLTWRYPIAVSASFGLLHGFGFASALSDIGLPQTEIPAALLAFNVGVEIGQVSFVGLILILVWIISAVLTYAFSIGGDWLSRIEKPIAYSVGSITMLWTLERVLVFWGA